MNKLRIGGLLMFIIGCSSYFFVFGEPYTTLAGLCAGIGFGMLFINAGTIRKMRRS